MHKICRRRAIPIDPSLCEYPFYQTCGRLHDCPGRRILASKEPLGTEELCKKYSMVPRQMPAVIYDAFLFNDELDMLEVTACPCAVLQGIHGSAHCLLDVGVEISAMSQLRHAKQLCFEYLCDDSRPSKLASKKRLHLTDVFTQPCEDTGELNSRTCLVQIRLSEVYDAVDHIVLVESGTTHQNQPKPLHYAENAHRFARFADKIIHIPLLDLLGDRLPDWFTPMQVAFQK